MSLGDAPFDGRVTLEAFSRVLAQHGCSPSPALGGGKHAPRAWDPSTTVTAISPFSSKPRPASSKGGQPKRQTTLFKNSQHPPSKHGSWAYQDVPRPTDLEPETSPFPPAPAARLLAPKEPEAWTPAGEPERYRPAPLTLSSFLAGYFRSPP